MKCGRCGTENPLGVAVCISCGATILPPPPSASGPRDPVEELVRETKRTAEELVRLAARLSRQVADKASEAAKDPAKAAKRAGNRVAKELDDAARELDRLLRKI